MKACGGVHLAAGWRSFDSFALRLFWTRVSATGISRVAGCVGPRAGSDALKKNFLPLLRIQPWFPDYPCVWYAGSKQEREYFYNVTVLENCIAPVTSKLIILVKPTLTKETRSFLKLSPLYKYSLYHPAFCKPLNYDLIKILLFFRHQLRT